MAPRSIVGAGSSGGSRLKTKKLAAKDNNSAKREQSG